MDKYKRIAEKVLVTFVEAALTYLIVVPHPQLNKTVVVGAVGAGLSAAYNLIRESQPTITPTPPTITQIPIQDVKIGQFK